MKTNFQTLLITGGTGSFGESFLKKAIREFKYNEIRIFSRDEKKQEDLRKKINNSKVKFYIGDVRDYRSVNEAVKGVDYIFHAAALKQVPSCEFFPIEAIKTNVLGTQNVLDAAKNEAVKKVVVLSTDKAAYPVNVMGMTKALMEKVMVAKARNLDSSKTIFCGTRYGNVMGSRGSVIPLFVNQIKEGKDLTITSPNMTRFIMTLSDAVDLVKYAFINGNQGDLFIQKSPAVTIKILAEALIDLYNSKSKIRQIGVRHGEKMFETLVTNEEMLATDDLGDYYRISADNRDLNYDNYYEKGEAKREKKTDVNSNNSNLLDLEETKKILLNLPEIKSDMNKK
jgi:UDP-N-acetylglucosamine 4,6-dehydratase/5-epimerase